MTAFVTDTKRTRRSRWERAAAVDGFRLTPRDAELVRAVWQLRFATCDQLCDLLFTPKGSSRCQRRLTLLWQNRFLDKVAGRSSFEADAYFVGREAKAGLKLLRAQAGSRDLLRHTRNHTQIEHVLAVNSIRCRLIRAARYVGMEIGEWRDQAGLWFLGAEAGLIPDAFFLLRQRGGERDRVAPFFLELERSPRDPRVMIEKYRRFARFCRDGGYERHFQRRTLRLLVVTAGLTQEGERAWATRLASQAKAAGLEFAFFASSKELLGLDPGGLLTAQVLRQVAGLELVSIVGTVEVRT